MTLAGRGPFRPSSAEIPAAIAPPQPKRRTLLDALAPRFGTEGAREFLRAVLADSGRSDVPDDSGRFDAFLREELVPRLVPLCRFDDVERFTRHVMRRGMSIARNKVPTPRVRESVAASRRRVVVLDPDGERRRALCRILVRDGFDVETASSAAGVLSLQPFDVLVLRPGEGSESMLAALARGGARSGVVVFDEPSARSMIRRMIKMWPNDGFTVASLDATSTAIAARVRIVARSC